MVKYLSAILISFALPISIGFIFHNFFQIAINTTDSLKNKIFLVRKNIMPNKVGQYVVFSVPNNIKYKEPFIKLVGGLEGDWVSRKGRKYFVNNNSVGKAKKHTKEGRVVNLGPTGLIPKDRYFVYTNNKDSYDSKYKEIGWIDGNNIIGRAYPIF